METRHEMTEHHHHHGAEGHVHAHPTQGHIVPRRPSPDELSHIQGWGADLDRKNRPAVPMERTPPRYTDAKEGLPEKQPERVEVLVSPERPGITPLFGTAQPPSGLSGMIRRAAFKSTENDLRHWMLLLLADRVNVVEGVVDDLAHGKVPNVFAEMGLQAEWKHNPGGLVKKAAIATAVVGTAWYLLNRRDRYR
ncbi:MULTISPECIES: hypothetical protein [unclassified Massilia]|uniref:hypothetical protein n=1 Tax=unclassified Massilia TaxID=2609279 RepID=UPI001B81FA4B|nr:MULTISPECIES: hypothetical protein [unclassified Massilia]MBQ5941280.1 hypothetical protein [Massilia sp. AB1]MBQ5962947.1 hypothetical protein [Massilia sp. ZL223]